MKWLEDMKSGHKVALAGIVAILLIELSANAKETRITKGDMSIEYISNNEEDEDEDSSEEPE